MATDDSYSNFHVAVEDNDGVVDYEDAFCGSGKTLGIQRQASYVITTNDEPFSLREFTFEFWGSFVVSVELKVVNDMPFDGFTFSGPRFYAVRTGDAFTR